MRIVAISSFVLLLAAAAAVSLSAPVVSANAATSERKSQCEAEKNACIAAGTQEGSNGVRYVPPDVVKQCYDGYRECMARG